MERQRLSLSAFLLSFSLLVSKALGFFKELLLAKYFGASAAVDAYVSARGTIESISGLLTAGVSVALVPVFAEFITKGKEKEGWLFLLRAFKLFYGFLAAVTCIGIIFAPVIVHVLLKGFTRDVSDLTIVILRGFFIYFMFVELGGFLQGVHQACKLFSALILWQAVPNLVIIIFVIAFSPSLGIFSMVFGFLLTGPLYFFFFYPAFVRRYREVNPSLYRGVSAEINAGLRRMGGMIFPMMLGQSFSYVVFFVDRFLASQLAEGSIASLNFAKVMMLLPQSLMTFPASLILYPVFAYAAGSDLKAFTGMVFRSLRMIFYILFFPSLFLFSASVPVVRLLYERGAFHPEDTLRVAALLKIYSPYFLFSGMSLIIIQAFYAKQDTRTPVKVTVVFSAFSVALSILLVRFLGVRGLALAATLSMFINFLFMLLIFRREYPPPSVAHHAKFLYKMACVGALTFLAAHGSVFVFDAPYFLSSLEKRVFALFMTGCTASAVYLGASLMFKVEELPHIWNDMLAPVEKKIKQFFDGNSAA